MKPESCEILFQKGGYCWANTNVLRFHMTHSPARPFERDSPHQNLKLRLSHRGWPNRRFLGELSRFWSSREIGRASCREGVKFCFRRVANDGQTQTFCVSI